MHVLLTFEEYILQPTCGSENLSKSYLSKKKVICLEISLTVFKKDADTII